MNLLLFEQNELQGRFLRIADRRADHIIRVLGLQEGDSVKVGMINGNIGSALITRLFEEKVELDVQLSAPPPVAPYIELILALPRPIMLQRILKQATVMGVRRFHLIRSRRVQKSFFQSSLLQSENIKDILVQGLEQTMDTRLPEVNIYNRFKPFIEDVVPNLNSTCRLLAHPDEQRSLPQLYADEKITRDFVLAIGPEGGWSSYEIEQFVRQGFCGFSMGRRILHVDTAVVALLSQLLLLGEMM